jgi:hypothetical protein
MAMTDNARKALKSACPQNREGTADGEEIADAIDAVTARVAAAVANIATADATDAASAVTLANANKAKINALLAALRTAGLLLP